MHKVDWRRENGPHGPTVQYHPGDEVPDMLRAIPLMREICFYNWENIARCNCVIARVKLKPGALALTVH